MSRWLAACRFLRVLGHLAAGWWRVRRQFPHLVETQKHAMVQAWSQRLLDIIGIELRVLGEPVQAGPLLLVANHISWIDITVIHAARYCRFVSKADVRHWPEVGALASGIGTKFNERESRRDAMRVVHHMAQSLRDGDVLTVFPEGTTSDGTGLLPFHGNLLQAAIAVDAPVQPVALRFQDAGSGSPTLAASYVGDDHLLISIWRTLSAAKIRVVVNFGPTQKSGGRDRRTWAADLRVAVAALRTD